MNEALCAFAQTQRPASYALACFAPPPAFAAAVLTIMLAWTDARGARRLEVTP